MGILETALWHFDRPREAGQRGALASDLEMIELPRIDRQLSPCGGGLAGTWGSNRKITRGWPNFEIGRISR